MKKITVFLTFLLVGISSFGQVSSYTFSQATDSYNSITGGINIPSTSTATLDDNVSGALPIGFTFLYNNIAYTQFGYNANGWITLGSLTPSSSSSPLSSGTTNNVVSAFGVDLIGRQHFVVNRTLGNPILTVTSGNTANIEIGSTISGTGIPAATTVISTSPTSITLSANATSTGTGSHARVFTSQTGVRYETLGTAPNRVLVVQWTEFSRYSTTASSGDKINFQIKLYETSNRIDVVYNLVNPTSTASISPQVGLRGATNTDFNNRTTTTDWLSTTSGATNTSNCLYSNTVSPNAGLTFTWTPPIVTTPPSCATGHIPVDLATNIARNSTLTWASVSGATSYDVYFGNTTNPSFVSNVVSTSFNPGILAPSTQYFWRIVPKNANGDATGCIERSFTTGTSLNYCTAVPTSIDGNGITNVQVGSFSNPNVTTVTYQNFTGLGPINIYEGVGSNVTISLATGYTYNVRVFVDLNQDGDFNDANENNYIGLSSSVNPTSISGNIIIPSGTALGTTRMRIVATDNDTSNDPCWSGSFANVEDYTLNILPQPTDTPDYVNLQWPPNATINRGSTVDVYAQVYEAGLTDVEPGFTGQAPGIQAWIGISPVGQNTNPNTWTTWIPAVWNSAHISNNDEYFASIGSNLASGTYYYATRFSLNNGPFRYGGIDAFNNGNFWDGVTYDSGILTVNPLPGDNCQVAIDLSTLSSPYSSTTVGGTDESNPSCGTNTAPDMHFRIDVPFGYRLNIQQTVNNYDSRNYVFYGNCSTQTSIACFDDPDTTLVSWLNETGTTQTVYWVNDGYLSNAGTFTLSWSLVEEPCYFSTTWNGTSWSNGTPNSGLRAILNGNYSGVGLTACALDVLGSAVVNFTSGTLNIDGAILIAPSASLNIQNGVYVLQSQNVANTGNATVHQNSAPMIRLDYTAWSSPVANQNLLAFSPNTVTNRFYTYDPAGVDTATSWIPVASPASTNFNAGVGYLIRVDNTWSSSVYAPFLGQFTGVLNNGNFSRAVGIGYNLMGNPYPSPIDATTFLNNNSTVGATTLYFWTHVVPQGGSYTTQSNYASYTTAGGVAASAGGAQPDGIIHVGQGFFVNATSSGNIQFTNAQRLGTSNGQFYRNNLASIERHRFWLNLTDNTNSYNQMMVAYMTGATNGIDSGIDGKLFTNSSSSIASYVNNESFVIQGRSLSFDVNDEVPLIFTANTSGDYSISLEQFDGLFANQDIFIWDKEQNIIHDLKTSAYSFSTLAGVNSNRFSIVYTNTILGSNDFALIPNVYVFTANNNIIIKSSKNDIKEINIFDIQGRVLVSKNKLNLKEIEIEKVWGTNQVLLIEIITDKGKTVKKIIL